MEVDEWYFLGVVLKVPVSKLKEIQGSSPQAGIRFWRIDVLYHWLQSTPHASWNDIVSALKKIGQHTLSARLQEKYITPYTAGTGMSCSTNAIVWMYSMSYCNTDCIVLIHLLIVTGQQDCTPYTTLATTPATSLATTIPAGTALHCTL